MARVPRRRRASHESVIKRVLNWLTVGYPKGVPPTERYALIALLHRTLTAEEVQQVIAALTAEHSAALEDGVITEDEIRDMIAKVVEDAPRDEDLRKVSARLAAAGWPLERPARKARIVSPPVTRTGAIRNTSTPIGEFWMNDAAGGGLRGGLFHPRPSTMCG